MSSRWSIVLLGIGLGVLSVTAFKTRPTSNLAGANVVAGGTIVDAHTSEPLTSWDMELRLDPGIRPPGWGWILHEGRSPGEGYQLHWLESTRVLQIVRARPVPFLLGAVTLPEIPERVTFRRRGGELSTLVDGFTVLRCLDPIGILEEPRPAPRAFGCATQGTLGEALLTVLVYHPPRPRWDSDLVDVDRLAQTTLDVREAGELPLTALEQRPDRAFLLTRRVFQLLDAQGDDGAISRALGAAAQALNPDDPLPRITSAGERERLSLWLALARARYALERETEAGDASLDLIEELIGRATVDPSPERIGVLLSLTEPLARRATVIPEIAMAPQRVAGIRARWLDLLHRVAEAARTAGTGLLAPEEDIRLSLLAHATACLRTLPGGEAPQPRPVAAPPWLAVRWRAFAGEDPQADSLPPMPDPNAPTARAVDQLAGALGLTPVPALGLRRRISDFLALRERWLRLGREGRDGVSKAEADVLNELRTAGVPPRERILTQALVALRLGATRPTLVADAWRSLGGAGLADRDPLAFALRQLLVRRFPDPLLNLQAEERRISGITQSTAQAAAAHPQGSLLDGTPRSQGRIWLARTAPGQALAAALVMQEVQGAGTPDWSLLDLVADLTLPLHLLQPPVERSSETDGTP